MAARASSSLANGSHEIGKPSGDMTLYFVAGIFKFLIKEFFRLKKLFPYRDTGGNFYRPDNLKRWKGTR